MFTKRQIIEELELQVLTKKDLVKIGKWAYAMYEQKIQNADEAFYNVLLDLAVMEYGSEHFLSLNQLDEIIDNLYKDLYKFDNDHTYTVIRFCRELKYHIRNKTDLSSIGYWAEDVMCQFDIENPQLYNTANILSHMAYSKVFKRLYQELSGITDALLATKKIKLKS